MSVVTAKEHEEYMEWIEIDSGSYIKINDIKIITPSDFERYEKTLYIEGYTQEITKEEWQKLKKILKIK